MTYGNCVARVKGRYEHLFDIFGEEPELLAEQALVSKELRAIVSTVLGTDEIRLEIGGVPAMPNAPVGRYHRDTFDLFGDQVDTQLPPWYLTLVIPLVDAVDDQQGTMPFEARRMSFTGSIVLTFCRDGIPGPTSFLLGTHRVPVNRLGDESKWQGEKAYLKAGQAALFDGRIIHRGEANNTSSIRPFLFMVFTAPWYIDKEADQLDRLSASPVA